MQQNTWYASQEQPEATLAHDEREKPPPYPNGGRLVGVWHVRGLGKGPYRWFARQRAGGAKQGDERTNHDTLLTAQSTRRTSPGPTASYIFRIHASRPLVY